MTLAPLLYTLDLFLLEHPFAYFLLEISIKTSLIITLAMVITYCYREQSASNISLIWLIAVIAALSVPLISLLVPGLTVELEVAASQLDNVDTSLLFTGSLTGDNQSVFSDQVLTSVTTLYLAGVMVLACYLVIGLLRLRMLARTAREIDTESICEMLDQLKAINGVTTKIVMLSSPRVTTPLTWGVLQHKILLPESALDWDKELLQQAISHELGHIQRNDWFYHILAKIVLCLYWPNPLAWFAARALKIESEKACDDAAVDCTGSNINYAQNLLGVANNIRKHTPYAAIGLFSRPSILAKRIHHILSLDKQRNFLRSDEILITILFSLLLVAPFSVLHFSARYIEPDKPFELDIPVAVLEPEPEIIEAPVKEIPTLKPVVFDRGYNLLPIRFEPAAKRETFLTISDKLPALRQVSYNFTLEQKSLYENWELVPLHIPDPIYPVRALKKGKEGYVVTEFRINDDGRVFAIKIIESVPTGMFEKSVLAAVNEFIYCPKIVKGIGGNNEPIRKRFTFSLVSL